MRRGKGEEAEDGEGCGGRMMVFKTLPNIYS